MQTTIPIKNIFRSAVFALLIVEFVFGQGVGGKTSFGGAASIGGGTGGAAPTFINGSNCQSGGLTCTMTVSVTAGQNTVVLCANSAGATCSIADTDSDTFTSCAGPVSQGTPVMVSQLFCAVFGTTNASEVVTVTISNSLEWLEGAMVFYSGGFSVVDQSSTFATTTNNATCTSGATSTTTNANELVVGACMADSNGFGPFTAGAGYTGRSAAILDPADGNSVGMEDKVVSSTGAQTATMTYGGALPSNGLVVTLHQ